MHLSFTKNRVFNNMLMLVVASIFSVNSNASNGSVEHKAKMGNYLAQDISGFMPLPLISSRTKGTHSKGVVGVALHETNNERIEREAMEATSNMSNASLQIPNMTLFGTLKSEDGSWATFSAHRHTWDDDRVRYTSSMFSGNTNMDYFVSYSDDSDVLNTNIRGSGGFQEAQLRVNHSQWFLGVVHTYLMPELTPNSNNYHNAFNANLVESEMVLSALGVSLEYNNTNSYFNPTSGSEFDAHFLSYNDSFGSTIEYNRLEIEATHYYPISERMNVSVESGFNQLYTDNDYLPPMVYPELELKGLAHHRFQGDLAMSLQAETTWLIDSNWSVSAFTGLGLVEKNLKGQVHTEQFHTFGSSVVFVMDTTLSLYSSLDIAYSEKEQVAYWNITKHL
ncbi:BamA/TamA family outer membrane protein [Vibrio sp.]|nr:BamA/TamA family outer membrane protein [Vibrio sp.]